ALYRGCATGFFSGDISRFLEDMATLKPTNMVVVPRLLTRMYSKIVPATIEAPGLTGILARRAVNDKLAKFENGGGYLHAFWDQILFRKIGALLGGRVRVMITGSAPIDGKVLNFLRIAFSCQIFEGQSYGCGVVGFHLLGRIRNDRGRCRLQP